MAVTADSIGVRSKQPPPGQQNGADESMPAAFQDKVQAFVCKLRQQQMQRCTLGLLQIWEALQQKLDRELHADKAARRSPTQAEAPADGVVSVQMFSSNTQQRRRKAAETTAALSQQQQGQRAPSKLKRRQLTFGKHAKVRPATPVLQHAAALLSISSTDRCMRCRLVPDLSGVCRCCSRQRLRLSRPRPCALLQHMRASLL